MATPDQNIFSCIDNKNDWFCQNKLKNKSTLNLIRFCAMIWIVTAQIMPGRCLKNGILPSFFRLGGRFFYVYILYVILYSFCTF